MCGIIAVIALDSLPTRSVQTETYRHKVSEEVKQGLDRIRHRGPDAEGQWISEDNRVALGHVRLSIKDLTPSGDQPLRDDGAGIYAVVNGEIYDYDTLRAELSKYHTFRTQSDSELVIALYKQYGVHFLNHLRGEFAICLYDAPRQMFIAARDRFGVKPLFYTVANGRLLVASEIKAFKALGWQAEWDVRSIMESGWEFGDRTLFKGVKKIDPGHYITCLSFEYITSQQYWEMSYPDKNIKETRTVEEMIEQTRDRFYKAVESRLQSDQPIGVYLSGGIDSSAIAGIARDIIATKRANDPTFTEEDEMKQLTCYSIGFDAATEYDEIPIAERTAAWLNRPLISHRMTEQDLADNLAATVIHCEQYFLDLAPIAKFKLSEITQSHGTKVVLTGEGSDEHFGGYHWFTIDSLTEPDLSFPSPATDHQRLTKLSQLRSLPTPGVHSKPIPTTTIPLPLAHRQLKGIHIPWATLPPIFCAPPFQTHLFSPLESQARSLPLTTTHHQSQTWHPLHWSQYTFTKTRLATMLLTAWGDRTEMAHSIEGRPPFLDHEFTRFVNCLPPNVKVRVDGDGEVREKWVLREAVREFVTGEVYAVRKKAFVAPYGYGKGGGMWACLGRLVTRERVGGLGFVDVEKVMGMFEGAFAEGGEGGMNVQMRVCFVVAQLVVLGEYFEVPPARPLSEV